MADDPSSARSAPNETPRERSRKRRFFIILLCVIVAVLVGAYFYYLHARQYEGTDDAFIDTHIVHLSPQVPGRVLHVLVSDNQRVHAGQLLVELDPADNRARFDSAQAQVQQAQAQLQQARTQVSVSQATLARAQAATAGTAAQAGNAASDLKRYLGLEKALPSAVSVQQLDQARTAAVNLSAQQRASVRQVDAARGQIAAARAQVSNAEAGLKTAQAQLQQARLTLGYTEIRAPVDGTIAQQTVAVGDYVQPGQQLLAIVPTKIWVTANFKETQLTYMRPGQKVDLKIYAYPDVHFVGHVDSIQRGAGQAFGLLPAQNATGNFVKVVQRVPVKIVIDSPRDTQYVLGPGMSVYATVHVASGRRE